MDKTSYVYILASHRNGTFYTGVTSDIVLRISQHRNGVFPGFTHDHRITALVCTKHCPMSKPPLRAKSPSSVGDAVGKWRWSKA